MGSRKECELSNEMADYNSCFMSECPLDQSENFEEWLDKNGVHYIITNEYLSDTVVYNKLDPLLNQVNTKDSTLSLDTFADNDILNEFSINSQGVVTEEVQSKVHSIVLCPLKADVDKNKKVNKSKGKVSFLKFEQFNNLIKNGLLLELHFDVDHYIVSFYRKEEKLPYMYRILSSEAGGQNQQDVKQSVVEVNNVEISPTLDVSMVRLACESGMRLFLCPHSDCDQAFFRLPTAKFHSLIHLEHKPYKCDFPNCTWAFYTSFKLRRHQETHSKKKDFVCNIDDCSRRFTTIYNLNCHKRLHQRPANLPCPVKNCNKKFQTARAREHHFKSHDRSEAPYSCTVAGCIKSFFLLASLTAHARTHSYKESELRCPNCGKVFEQPCRLKEHLRQHTGQKPYLCTFEDCKWAFPTASKLKRHQSTHTNERKFHCTIGTCNKSFLRSEHLKEHTLTHIGQRTFQCEGIVVYMLI